MPPGCHIVLISNEKEKICKVFLTTMSHASSGHDFDELHFYSLFVEGHPGTISVKLFF